MLIALTTITPDKQWKDFCLLTDDVELSFTVLIGIVKAGDTIVEARLIDEERSDVLPLDFLDQTPVCNPLSQLRKQWEKALTQPPAAHPENKTVLPEWVERRVLFQHQHFHHLLEMIHYTQALVQITQEMTEEGSRKRRLLAQYQQTMDRCSRAIVRLETTSLVVNRYWQKGSFR